MTKSKQPLWAEKEASSDPMSPSAFDRAFYKVAAELGVDEATSLRSDFLNSASSPGGLANRPTSASADDRRGGEISPDTCNFFLAAGSFSEQRGQDPLDALDGEFRKNVGWQKQPGAEPSHAADVVVGMRRPAPEFVAGSERRFVALDPRTYRGDAVVDRASHQEFWDKQINGRPFSMSFLKSGAAIWKKLGIKVTPEETAYMLQMNRVDPETSEAIQAAVWSAFNTARYPIDIEAVVFALGSFIHADPLRRHLVSDEKFVDPYGDRTVYGLRKGSGPGAHSVDSSLPSDGSIDDDDVPELPARPGSGQERPRSERYLPIEADSELRAKIEADSTIDPDHLGRLNDLKLLLTSDAEKMRVFCGSLDQEARVILNKLLEVAIREIEVDRATVVGIVNILILEMLDICVGARAASAP
jgi:hypothetical protein